MTLFTRRQMSVLAVLVALLAPLWFANLGHRPAGLDASQSIDMAYNLMRHGVIGQKPQAGVLSVLETARPVKGGVAPSMYREPLPVMAIAGSMAVSEALRGPAPVEAYLTGDRTGDILLQNLLWMALLTLSVAAVVRFFTGSFALSVVGALAVNALILMFPANTIGETPGELPPATLLMLASALAAAAVERRSLRLTLAAAVALAVLTLAKATFLYVGVCLVVAVCLLEAWRVRGTPSGRFLAAVAAASAAFLLVLAPWMTRNQIHFGTPSLTARGGHVLLIRAYKDLMTPVEYAGSFYAWAPGPLKPVVGAVTGFGPDDLQRGGRLQRFNRERTADFKEDDLAAQRAGRPDLAITYFRKAGAEMARLKRELVAAGDPNAQYNADKVAQDEAMQIIRSHPLRHLAVTIPILWRGGCFSILAVVGLFGWAAWTRRTGLAMFLLPSLGLAAFLALLTHFIPRYLWAMLPVFLVAALLTARMVWLSDPLAGVRGLAQEQAGRLRARFAAR